jgi:DNA-binding CsgD family transcriptional regulator
MTLLDVERTSTDAGLTGLGPAAERALREARDGGLPGSVVVVQGPGGSGKTCLLNALGAAYTEAGLRLADARSVPETGLLAEDTAIVVDDAHRLSTALLERVRHVLGSPRSRVVLALRPWPRPSALATVLRELGSDRQMVVLGHMSHDLVAEWARERLGRSIAPDLVDQLHTQTGGLRSLVHPILQAMPPAALRPAERWIPLPRQGTVRLPVPAELIEQLCGDLMSLDEDVHRLLSAVACGAPVDIEVLANLLDIPERATMELVSGGRASGYLLPDGRLVPLVARALSASTPADVTLGIKRRLLGVLIDRGEEPLGLAESLAADGVRDGRAAELLERTGSAALSDDPRRAARLLGEAAACGSPAPRTAARRAHAAALCGDFDGALQWADLVLDDDTAPDRARAGAVAGAVLAARGLLARSAELYRLAGPERAGSTALALLATGREGEAVAVLADAERTDVCGPPTMLAGSEQLMATGILQSLRHGPDTAEDIAAALSTLTRAAALLEPVGRTALLIDTPTSLAALVALHCGELDVAESVLRRGLSAELGGPPLRPRHLLLLAWVAMLRGQTAMARAHMDAATEGVRPLEPREDLLLQALHVGLARRSSDLPALVQAWVRAREAVVRYPIDLFALLPLGELVIAGARLKDAERLAPYLAEALRILAALGHPQLWATPLHWSSAQAAILTDNPSALEPHATALVAAARTSPYAATLAQAGRSWLRVLRNDVDAPSVVQSAESLATVGLGWDGSRLAGQAAARALHSQDRTVLLQCARSLTEARGIAEATAGPASWPDAPTVVHLATGGALSEREREVARLVVAGETYREIGGKLFISSKTVEHHVSRMRQRLGASNRSDLLARLRAELAASA